MRPASSHWPKNFIGRAIGTVAIAAGISTCSTATTPSEVLSTVFTQPPVSTSSGSSLDASKITADAVTSFEWAEAGQVCYSVNVDNLPRWYTYDPATKADKPSGCANQISEVTRSRISEGGQVEILNSSVSPNADKILYERQPLSDTTSIPAVTPSPYSSAVELWLAEKEGTVRRKLTSNFASLSLEAHTVWRLQDTLALGAYEPPYGIPNVYFLVNTENAGYTELSFPPPGILLADLSHGGTRLGYSDQLLNLWIIPTDNLAEQLSHGPDPNDKMDLPGEIYSPIWSVDDQWIYFWQKPRYQANLDKYPVTLRRINVSSKQIEVVANADELEQRLGMGYEKSINLMRWRLASNDNQALAVCRREKPICTQS